MLYTHAELQNTVHRKVALQRYLYKFANHRKEVKRLKLHEKEFMFRSMNAIIQVPEGLEGIELDFETDIEAYQYLEKNGLAKRAFNLYEIEEAHEYVFYKIVLTYYHNLNFLMPAHGPLGLLSKEEILVDKSFFEYYYPIWQKLLFSGKGSYMTHILPEYNRKYKILEDVRKDRLIGYNAFKSKNIEIILACYHIYYKVKFFFDGYGKLYHKFEIEGIPFVFDVYSYVHILSRHYMPDTNSFDVEKSFNDELPFVDIDNLPFSFESLLQKYNTYCRLSVDNQFVIFQFKSNYYIIWLKYEFFDIIKDNCVQIRSFYKIKEKRDMDKVISLTKKQISNELYFYG